MHFLGCLLFILLFVFLLVIALVGNIYLRIMRFFGFNRKFDWEKEYFHSPSESEQKEARHSTNKVFADDEGEYVDFEEVR